MTYVQPKQRGLALPTVMAMLFMASVSTVLAWRQLWVNELLLKAEADQLRTQHKAEAALLLAVQDVLGSANAHAGMMTASGNSAGAGVGVGVGAGAGVDINNGSSVEVTKPLQSLGDAAPQGARYNPGDITQTHVFFPTNMVERDLLRQRLGDDTCRSGICALTPPKPDKDDPYARAATWKNMTASAMPISANDTPYGTGTAWYWIDIQPDAAQIASASASATNAPPFIYRITVLANGVLPSSSTVLQTLWSRTSLSDARGRRHSWRILQD